ncbi:hypothetical protein [Methylobacterium haplocladii]|uniref:Uncharacterized protein n=1 Tax=Methylobacterium haplocladii TaxID=1176176 RepID=A0A512ITY5_9HYPH|nr:hypothetical protein [Methylobacterium haplocladii]GEP01170.1 hypothetical protein MHA02_35570 [Methylobacterium haplocladii]GJD82870.1 hypothetical protein HPGCJGGD_0732 [Methylobacterium haplocladii]GLS59005.1 hypothetical protein GCM10007887_16710 [Methylobacterium haplocladii]
MPFGESSLTAWILLWVAALSSLATFAITLRRDAQARRKALAEKEQLWSLTWAEYLDDGPFRCLRLRLHDVDKHKCRLKTVTLKRPGAGRLAPQTWIDKSTSEPWHKRAQADRTALGRRIAVAKDLDGSNARFSGQSYDDVYIYVLMPRRPAFSFAAQTQLRVVCRISEISRRARRRKITLISPPADWAAADAPKPEDVKQTI